MTSADLRQRVEALDPDRLSALSAALRATRPMTVARLGRRDTSAPAPPSAPLSAAQRGLWVQQQLNPESVSFVNIGAVRVYGPLNVDALRRALDTIEHRHTILRTAIADEGQGHLVQRVAPEGARPLTVAALDDHVRSEALRERLMSELARPLDLHGGTIWRTALFRVAPEEHVLGLAIHHIALDQTSESILLRELSEAYAAHRRGLTPDLAELPVQYADFAAWQAAWLASEACDAQCRFWRRQLAGASPAPRSLRSRTGRPSGAASYVDTELAPGLGARVQRIAVEHEATPFMVMLAGFFLLLHAHSGENDLSVGTAAETRTLPELRSLIGCFVNMLALRSTIDLDLQAVEYLARVRTVAIDAFSHQEVPYERVLEECGLGRGAFSSPFDTAFGLVTGPPETLALDGLRCEPIDLPAPAVRYDLTLWMRLHDGRLSGRWTYDSGLFEAAAVARLASDYEGLLDAFVSQPTATLRTLVHAVRPRRGARFRRPGEPAQVEPAQVESLPCSYSTGN